MKFKKTVTTLVIIIALFSIFVCVNGIFSIGGPGRHDIESFRGESVTIYGQGIYSNDSVSVAAQAVAQDVITLFMGVPLLLTSLYFALKGSLKGRLLLAGTLGYFLYTYVSYTFLSMYNPMFLLYTILMSSSFFTFIMCLMSINAEKLKEAFDKKLPIKLLGGFQIFLGIALCLLWLGKIYPTIASGAVPVGLEHYTTLVIQGMDLGFIVPVAFLSGILLIRRKPFGYLLSSVVIMKGFTMGAALTAMIINQYLAGVKMGIVEIIMFPLFSLVLCICLIVLLKNVKQSAEV